MFFRALVCRLWFTLSLEVPLSFARLHLPCLVLPPYAPPHG